MNTEIFKPTNEALHICASLIRQGEIIVCPTDTLYGLSTGPYNYESVKQVFKIKKRENNNPVILLIPQNYDIKGIVSLITPAAQKLMDAFWPGPLTLIFKNDADFSPYVTCNHNTVSLRVPNNKTTLELLNILNAPITSTSANISGMPNIKSFEIVKTTFLGKVAAIIDDGDCKDTVPSTIVDVSSYIPRVVREGAISKTQIFAAL